MWMKFLHKQKLKDGPRPMQNVPSLYLDDGKCKLRRWCKNGRYLQSQTLFLWEVDQLWCFHSNSCWQIQMIHQHHVHHEKEKEKNHLIIWHPPLPSLELAPPLFKKEIADWERENQILVWCQWWNDQRVTWLGARERNCIACDWCWERKERKHYYKYIFPLFLFGFLFLAILFNNLAGS